MIPKGLTVGETYLEGNLVHKITKVVDGELGIYEGTWTGEILSEPSVEQPEITDDSVNYEELPYAQLKKLCAEKGINAVGSKADLVARLEG